jgi:hypothetical protein
MKLQLNKLNTKNMDNYQQQIINRLQELKDAIDEKTGELTKLREGDYYGDSLPDAMADIAKSLRILSKREQN